jgi:hypothetical protein
VLIRDGFGVFKCHRTQIQSSCCSLVLVQKRMGGYLRVITHLADFSTTFLKQHDSSRVFTWSVASMLIVYGTRSRRLFCSMHISLCPPLPAQKHSTQRPLTIIKAKAFFTRGQIPRLPVASQRTCHCSLNHLYTRSAISMLFFSIKNMCPFPRIPSLPRSACSTSTPTCLRYLTVQ